MSHEPYFLRDGDRFVPTRWARGPWKADMLHGRTLAGLLGHEIERRHATEGFRPVRMTVDMFKAADMSAAEIVTTVVRDGGRIRLVDAEFISGGSSVGRASCQLLRSTGEQPQAPAAQNWDAPAPDQVPQAASGTWRSDVWEMRPISFDPDGQALRRMWMTEHRDLVEGVAMTPFAQLALGADIVSPLIHGDAKGLSFINSDLTIYLHRAPGTKWIGFEADRRAASDGIGVGSARIYDEDGLIGVASCAALGQKTMVPWDLDWTDPKAGAR